MSLAPAARSLTGYAFPQELRILVLAPHPDDFDAVGVTMRFFQENGNPLYLRVATSGASGVEDVFCSPPPPEVKAALREQEQRASCRYFGLPEQHLAFLRLEENKEGHPLMSRANGDQVRQQLQAWKPAIVFMPHWRDTNVGHQRVYEMFRPAAERAGYPLAALLNEDPKTIQMRYDLYLAFGETEAAWKGELLRRHQSQHQRNLRARGHGIDERILRVNRRCAQVLALEAPYAEAFEVVLFGAKRWEEILRP